MPKLIDLWVHEFDDETVRRLRRRIERCAVEEQSILPLYIMSGGGSVSHLLAMQDLITASPVKVATVCVGQAISAGADLLASGTKGLRWASSGAKIMVHECAGGLGDDKFRENKATLKSDIADERLTFDRLDDNCGKPRGYFMRELAKRRYANWYMFAAEAKRHGIIDQVGVPRFDIPSAKRVEVCR